MKTMTAMSEPPRRRQENTNDDGVGCLCFLWGFANLLLSAVLLSHFWVWFLHPVIPTIAAEVSVPEALGLLLCVRVVQRLWVGSTIENEQERFRQIKVNSLRLGWLFVLGYVLHYLMVNGLPIYINIGS